MIAATEFVRAARQMIGVPWAHQGRSSRGVDCIGLVIVAGRMAGVDFFRAAGIAPIGVYGRKADPRLYALVEQHCEPTQQQLAGTLALFRFRGEKHARHFGIITETGTLIHADSKSRRCVIEHGYRMHWVTWTDSLWRLPGIEYCS